ncbi:hypothetical protein FVE85_8015 [Porphyridium purpureum]|uniref:Uncharacterized protein n=1 Tax=Porphyridium purpureum TaxID=35688 RepID=A0A5J4YMP0_PORPP|nr:hypothetical protein FVE85_8015 [Porphyridium purpureum]|eukprot:POR0662..scf295_9
MRRSDRHAEGPSAHEEQGALAPRAEREHAQARVREQAPERVDDTDDDTGSSSPDRLLAASEDLPNIFVSVQSSQGISRSDTVSSLEPDEQSANSGSAVSALEHPTGATDRHKSALEIHELPPTVPRTLEQKHGVMDYPPRDLMFEYVLARKSHPQSTLNSASKVSLAGTPSLGPRAASALDPPAAAPFSVGLSAGSEDTLEQSPTESSGEIGPKRARGVGEISGSVLVARLDELIQEDVQKRYPNLMAKALERSKTSAGRPAGGTLLSPPDLLSRSRTAGTHMQHDSTWLHALDAEDEYLKENATDVEHCQESWRTESPSAPKMAPRGFSDYAYRAARRRNMVFYRGDYCFNLAAIQEDTE